jgi:ABC-2 type transport system ATP-binding protein
VIEVSHLTKRYGNHTAVRDLSFTIESGRIYGFLGPNGAGKSTTMNIITGCLAATSGQVRIGGHDIFEEPNEAKRLIGYLPELPPLYLDMTPEEYLQFVASAKGVAKSEAQAQIQHAMDVTQIADVSQRLIKHLSKGYRQRVGLAQSLLGNPEVIILDEPTVGLDPKQITEIRDLIKSLGEKHTVILSSHILSEVRAVCDHVMIISHGELVASDTPDNLERYFAGSTTVELLVRGEEPPIRAALSGVENIAETVCSPTEDGTIRVVITANEHADIREAVFFALAGAKLPILQMNTARASLEDVFLELTSDKGEEADAAAAPAAGTAAENLEEKEADTDESDL